MDSHVFIDNMIHFQMKFLTSAQREDAFKCLSEVNDLLAGPDKQLRTLIETYYNSVKNINDTTAGMSCLLLAARGRCI